MGRDTEKNKKQKPQLCMAICNMEGSHQTNTTPGGMKVCAPHWTLWLLGSTSKRQAPGTYGLENQQGWCSGIPKCYRKPRSPFWRAYVWLLTPRLRDKIPLWKAPGLYAKELHLLIYGHQLICRPLHSWDAPWRWRCWQTPLSCSLYGLLAQAGELDMTPACFSAGMDREKWLWPRGWMWRLQVAAPLSYSVTGASEHKERLHPPAPSLKLVLVNNTG